ncbi:hypothetical protein P8452_27731 [Trifolium repens]|nr:hypothetical protein P8452_27731 [Trifolium repens]
MCDGWINGINHMHIMNFLVHCSRGTVFIKSIDASNVASRNTEYYFNLLDKMVEEVGEEYVVQIVTDNEAALKAAGLKLMEKRPTLYWSPCAAHCLDLCLEDIGKKSNVQKVLDEAKKKQALKAMFDSDEYKNSKYGKDKSGGAAYEAKKIVMSKEFWNKATEILKVFEPIVKVLKLVDGDVKPTMGFLYEAMDRAKQAIEKNCRYHTFYNAIIDKRWTFMHSDLHSAGYFLNPQFQYGNQIYIQIRANNQLLLFRDKQESFGTPQAQQAWRESDPAEWWLIYGSSAPELQRVAVRVLSLTTSASNYPLSPWVKEIEGPLLDGTQNAEWLPVESDDDDIEEIVGDDVDDLNSGQTPSQSGEGGLSPPSDENSGGNGGGEQVHGVSEGSHNSFQEEAYVRRDQNLLSHRMEEESCDGMTGGGSSRGRARRGNQGNFPSYYQNPSYMPLGYYPYMTNPNTPFYNDAPMNYNDSSTNSSYDHQQIEPPRSSGLFDYVFGRGGNDNDEGDSGSYDLARRSTMW